jgi:hypothetical protein
VNQEEYSKRDNKKNNLSRCKQFLDKDMFLHESKVIYFFGSYLILIYSLSLSNVLDIDACNWFLLKIHAYFTIDGSSNPL